MDTEGIDNNYINADVNRNPGLARASLYIGIVSLLAWIIPLIGLPLSITGLVLGLVSLNSPRRDMARAGISLGVIGLFLTVAYMILAFYLVTSGFLSDFIEIP